MFTHLLEQLPSGGAIGVRHPLDRLKDFGRLFSNVAGKPKEVYEMRSLISKRRFYPKRLKLEPVHTK